MCALSTTRGHEHECTVCADCSNIQLLILWLFLTPQVEAQQLLLQLQDAESQLQQLAAEGAVPAPATHPSPKGPSAGGQQPQEASPAAAVEPGGQCRGVVVVVAAAEEAELLLDRVCDLRDELLGLVQQLDMR
jgi:hypothetical protein